MIFTCDLSSLSTKSTWFARYSNVSIPNVRGTEVHLSSSVLAALSLVSTERTFDSRAPLHRKTDYPNHLHPRYLAPSCRFSSMTFDPVPWNLTNSSPRSKANYPGDVSRDVFQGSGMRRFVSSLNDVRLFGKISLPVKLDRACTQL